MTMRIAIGFFIQIVALLSAGIIELVRYKMVRDSGLVTAFIAAGPDADPLDPKFTEPMRWVDTRGLLGYCSCFHWQARTCAADNAVV